ncbi:embryogenesis-associated protein EMB8 isoform X2 [Populus alba x Populus x berolinensis]|uniref:Embryogenesis-associated protein EMB8 isoform X2 n=1 Tax=Populus alba x Populus x berolinensis TaxID=444605 RepID=A0AAD6R4M1_9ROSI|nr:embryogenesis-associated protein EMB8 isoform X2 [Populus alba x Populus x berolinensis]
MEEDYRASSYDYDELFVKSLSLFSISQNHLLLLVLLLFLLLLLFLAFLVFFYNFLEIHFLADLLTAFRGDPVSLTYNPSSQLYKSVASKCRILHGRFLPTPWLSSPHLQTAFLSLVEKSPHVTYKRRMFYATDGGTIALDWLMSSDVKGASCTNDATRENDKTPILIVIPGLTSDSGSAYVKHLVDKMAKHGWNVVVSNHRGLGGISITSDCFYNAGWTEDVRKVIDHIHCQYPEAPLYAVGTSIGANILVKYLGEDGLSALLGTFWHESILSRLTDWDGVKKSRSVRDFDNYATRILGKFETVDAYYRRSSCVNFVGNVSVPLLCISAMDDPVCTREAIPWDECRANENIILAVTQHGGHLAYYEGISADSMWWVRAVDEFFDVLQSSPLSNRRKKVEGPSLSIPPESSIDQGPYVNVLEDGMVTVVGNSQEDFIAEDECNEDVDLIRKDEDAILQEERSDLLTEKTHSKVDLNQPLDQNLNDLDVPVRRRMDQLLRLNRNSIWLLAYIAVVTTWPLVGSALLPFLKKRFKSIIPSALRLS